MATGNEATIYQEVKAWIAQQEAFEAEHKRPAPLTNVQRKALEALRLPASSPTPPAIGDVNYVGLLQEYRQRHPSMGEIIYTEEASGVLSGGTPGRVCRVTIAESLSYETDPIEAFPAAGGYGLDEDTGRAPVFSTKKVAKHFAAKCAVDWLVARGLMQPHGQGGGAGTLKRLPTLGTTNSMSPPAKRQSVAQAPPAATDSTEDTPVADSKATADGGPTPAAASGRPATELVVGLCKELNIPAPQYKLEISTVGAANIFDGSAAFDDYGDQELIALRDGSAVKGVAGRESARQAIAEKLLVLLRTIDAERDAQYKLLIGKIDVDTDNNGAAL